MGSSARVESGQQRLKFQVIDMRKDHIRVWDGFPTIRASIAVPRTGARARWWYVAVAQSAQDGPTIRFW
jgi:hypothetical protein